MSIDGLTTDTTVANVSIPPVPADAMHQAHRIDAGPLRRLCGGDVHLPGDPGYDAARMPWNVAVDQRPAAVVHRARRPTCPRSCGAPPAWGCASPRRARATTPDRSPRTTCPTSSWCACPG